MLKNHKSASWRVIVSTKNLNRFIINWNQLKWKPGSRSIAKRKEGEILLDERKASILLTFSWITSTLLLFWLGSGGRGEVASVLRELDNGLDYAEWDMNAPCFVLEWHPWEYCESLGVIRISRTWWHWISFEMCNERRWGLAPTRFSERHLLFLLFIYTIESMI